MSSSNTNLESLQNARILIVDDNAINVRVVQAHLQKAGFTTFESAEDGLIALEKIETFKPDILILDLLMPNMDGFEVIQHLRSKAAFKQLPIVVQTALTNPEEQNDAWKSGANDLVTKPIHPLELVARVTAQLKQSFLLKALTEYQHAAEADISESLELQQNLLPEDGVLDAFEEKYDINFKYIYLPCRFLSGDIWGAQAVDENKVAFWIADFTGKGIRASLNTFRLHAYLQKLNVDYGNPAIVLDELNKRLTSVLKRGTFATFLYGVYDRLSRKFIYASAGSTNPIIYHRKNKTMKMLEARGVPMGITANVAYENHEYDFSDDESLLLYSDFLWESRDLIGVSFEDEDLVDACKILNGKKAVASLKKILKEREGTFALTDDFTLLELSMKS